MLNSHRYLIILTLVCFLSLDNSVSLGQDGDNSPRLQLGVNGGPLHSFRNLEREGGDEYVNYLLSSRNENEIPGLGFNAGFGIEIYGQNNLALSLGLAYTEYRYRRKEYEFSQLYLDGTSNRTGTAIEYYYNKLLELPIMFGYRMSKKRFQLIPSVGLTASIALNYTSKIILNFTDNSSETLTSTGTISRLNAYQFAISARARLQYLLNDKVTVFAAPLYTRYFTPLFDSPLREFLWGTRLNCGLLLNLR